MTMTGGPEVFSGDFWRDPYPAYELLREHDPVVEVPLPTGGTTWLITRYDDVLAAFSDERLVKDVMKVLPSDTPDTRGPASSMMLLTDPPDHTRLRKLVTRAFTARRVAELRPRVEEIASGLLDQLSAAGSTNVVDLIDGYAVPLPAAVICELLGIPNSDRAEFNAWSDAMIDDAGSEDGQAASLALGEYIGRLLRDKAAAPDAALLSALLAVSEEDDRLSPREVVGMGILLLVAGYETSANLIGNTSLGVLGDPELRERARETAALPPLIEEFLRFDGPVHNAPVRFAEADVEYSGVTIPAGSSVTLSIGSANRDPSRFDRPDIVDSLRPAERGTTSLAFGHGIHYCLGASLARVEGEVAIAALLGRFPAASLATAPDLLEHRQSTIVNGLKSLPVRLGPADSV